MTVNQFFILIFLFISCSAGKGGNQNVALLPDSSLVNLITDVFVMQSALDDTPISLRDSAAEVYQNQIAELYGHPWEELHDFLTGEGKELEEMDQIYSSVLSKIKAIEDESN